MDFSLNHSMSFSSSSSSILSWCINDTVDPEAILTSSEIQSYGEANVTLSKLCNTETSDIDTDDDSFSSKLEAFLVISLGLMIFATIIGNILVCLSVILVRKLRHPSNYLLVSLAISDLCVAILVMPLALHYELNGTWNLSPKICDLWVSFDVTCCTSSILNLCMISIDRYLAITKPLTYGVRRTAKRILSFICAVWVTSCLISIPPLLVLGNEHGTDTLPTCEVSQNIGYQLYATLGAFYIPLMVMIFMYYKIYVAAKRVVDAEQRAQVASSAQQQPQIPLLRHHNAEQRAQVASSPQQQPQIPLLLHHQQDTPPRKTETGTVWLRIEGYNCYENTQNTETIAINVEHHNVAAPLRRSQTNGMSMTGNATATVQTSPPLQSSSTLKPDVETQQKRTLDSSAINMSIANKRRTSSVLRERKASFTLGVIMTAFTVCWLPFFILALLRPFSASVVHIPRFITSTTLWLGYANSMLNPIIYVTFHQDFRRAFKYLLCLQCATMGSRLRAEAYQSQYGTDRGHYGGDFGTNGGSGCGEYGFDNKMRQYRERRSTAVCSSVEITSRDKIESEAKL